MKKEIFELMKTRFEYLILSAWMLIFTIVIVHLLHHNGADSKGVDWALNAFSAMLGALLGLIQGQRIASNQRATDAPALVAPINVNSKEEVENKKND